MSVKIISVDKGSPADKAHIKPGDSLVSINKNAIHDILDYQFYSSEEKLKVELEDRTVTVKKDEYEDLGLNFETYLMDCKQHCKNNCVFCFINQLPKGMRDTLYFKDDDSRLSFLQGNYITMTNLSDE
ncbi:MAG: PDZ domain-containing protein, partial [Ruminiclostridium sp.]